MQCNVELGVVLGFGTMEMENACFSETLALTHETTQRQTEDGDSFFLRNVGMDLRNHTAQKPKTTATLYSSP